MDRAVFERVAAEEFARVPKKFSERMVNVALLIEDEPSDEVRASEGLTSGETLLGLYHGIPATARGDSYSGVLPDTITLFRLPLMEEARALWRAHRAHTFLDAIHLAIRETLWHEIAHYFGLDEEGVREREEEGTNRYRSK